MTTHFAKMLDDISVVQNSDFSSVFDPSIVQAFLTHAHTHSLHIHIFRQLKMTFFHKTIVAENNNFSSSV